jgi:hypothetical protein
LEQDFVDRLVEQMSSFLLGGRGWTVERVVHNDRIVVVREAPGGVKPSWGGFIPQHLGFDLCQRMKRVLTDTVRYPYVDAGGSRHIEEKRGDLGELLRRPGHAVQLDGSMAHWWTFAGGRVNHTLKYAFEVLEGWKVVADNFQLRIEGDGIDHESVRKAIGKMSSPEFWDAPDTRRAVLARLPGYRLSKFQDCLPEKFALEVIENYLLDVAGTLRWLGGASEPQSPSRRSPRVQICLPGGDVPTSLLPALEGRWGDLPERLSVDELCALAHMANGYDIETEHLRDDLSKLTNQLKQRFIDTATWEGNAVELLAVFFAVVRGWRGHYDYPQDGDESHREAQCLYEAVKRRLSEHSEEVELVPAPGSGAGEPSA